MIKFENYFKILLGQKHISESSLIRFLDDHLQRLITNNPGGKYDELIAGLAALLNDYKLAIAERNLHQALQQSRTKKVDKIIAEFKRLISRKEGVILDVWDARSIGYKQFYPHGLDEYNRATKSNVSFKMNRYIDLCELHTDELPEGFANRFITLRDDYENSRKEQLGMIGSTDGNRVNVAQKRLAVAMQVTRNLLLIAADYLGKPNMVKAYFDQSIVRRPEKKNGSKPKPDVFSDAVPPETKAVILHGGFDAGTRFHIVNTGSVEMVFYTAGMPADAVPGSILKLPPGEQEEITASALGASGNLFLMAYNPSASLAGSFEVRIDMEE